MHLVCVAFATDYKTNMYFPCSSADPGEDLISNVYTKMVSRSTRSGHLLVSLTAEDICLEFEWIYCDVESRDTC